METLLHPLHLLTMYAETIAAAIEDTPARTMDDLHAQITALAETLWDRTLDAEERGDTDAMERLQLAAESAECAEHPLELLAYEHDSDPDDDSRNAWEAHTHLAESARLARLEPAPGRPPKLDSPDPPAGTPEGQAPRGECMQCSTQSGLQCMPQEEWEGALGRHLWLCTTCYSRTDGLRERYRRVSEELISIGRGPAPWSGMRH